MSAFVDAPFSTSKNPYASAPPPYSALGSIGYVLQNQLGRRIRPTQFNTALPYHLLCEEVPYSKRLEIMPYDPARYEKEAQEGWRNPEDVHFLHDTDNETNTNTQAFITHNDKVVLSRYVERRNFWPTPVETQMLGKCLTPRAKVKLTEVFIEASKQRSRS